VSYLNAQVFELHATPGTWRLTRADPSPQLAGVVKEYWEVEGTLDAFRETLLPNGFVEIMYNLGPPHRVLEGPSAGVWDRSWFSGLQERSLMIESLNGTHLLSARLHPLGAREMFGAPVAGAANLVVALETVIGAASAMMREELTSADSPLQRFEVLDRCLLTQLSALEPSPLFVREASAQIEAAHGNVRVGDLHKSLGASRKHLAVTFTRHLGMPAKSYAQIHRFLWTLEQLRQNDEVDWSVLAHEAGYSDQSHLVRDFRRVGAATPTEYLRQRAPNGDALLYGATSEPTA